MFLNSPRPLQLDQVEGPKFIKDMLSIKTGRAGLRSKKSIELEVPRTKLVSWGDRAFCKTVPTLWNELSHEVRLTEKLDTFKSRLKTKLFKEYYK